MNRVEFETCTKDKILKSFAELSKYGFNLEEETMQNGDYDIILFNNLHVTIRVAIPFINAKKWNILGLILIYINNNSNGDGYNIQDYFTQYKGIDYKDVPFDHRIYDTDNIEQQIDNYLKSVINILQTELLDVITGKKWIHVPMDWHGAK